VSTPRAGALRRRLVEELVAARAIRSPAVRRAFLTVPREAFLSDVAAAEGLEAIYRNDVIVTQVNAAGVPTSSSSQPQLMAAMLERLRVEPGMRILEVGTGTGWNAALLRSLVGPSGEVVSVEVDSEAAARARDALRHSGHEVDVRIADGRTGAPDAGPFDRIIVTASAAELPRAWRDQLRPNGLLEVPLRLGAWAQAVVTLRRDRAHLRSVSTVTGRFMSLRAADGDGGVPPPAVLAIDADGLGFAAHLAGPALKRMSASARRRALGAVLSDPRRSALTGRVPAWSLGLYLAIEIPDHELVTRLPMIDVGTVTRDGRGLALVRGRWEGGQRPSKPRILAFGDPRAEHRLTAVLEEWERRGRPGPDELRIDITFRGPTARPVASWAVNKRG
jgi:protein-L-isoaspartate(D-aspartate) O-methyltransferase